MKLIKLTRDFYNENTHLVEALDNFNGNWQKGKTRGYGVVVVSISSLTFAIPLRSNIKHSAAYLTKRGEKNVGLDYSKALLITDPAYISGEVFKIPDEEHKLLLNKAHFIESSFQKYVERYVQSLIKSDHNVLNSKQYKYTTLKNYHDVLLTTTF